MTDPFRDPVREAFARYLDRFPEVRQAHDLEPTTHALLKQMERMMVCADAAMRDEGLSHEARRRVVSAALYGGPDEEAMTERLRDQARQREFLIERDMVMPNRVQVDDDGKLWLGTLVGLPINDKDLR